MDIPWVHLIWEKYYSNGRLPGSSRHGSFWWKDILKLSNSFKGMSRVIIKDGATCFLRQDLWTGQILDQSFPELFSYAKNTLILVKKACQSQELYDLFHLPLSVEAFQRFQVFSELVDNLNLTEDTDVWTYIWNSNIFSSQKAYAHLIGTMQVHPAFSWHLKSCSQNKRKVFSSYLWGIGSAPEIC